MLLEHCKSPSEVLTERLCGSQRNDLCLAVTGLAPNLEIQSLQAQGKMQDQYQQPLKGVSGSFQRIAASISAETQEIMQGITVALEDGAAHAVDSSEMAFKLAAQYAFRTAFTKANPVVLEPIMTVQVVSQHHLSF